MRKPKSRRSRRMAAIGMITAMLVAAGGVAAFAYHDYCNAYYGAAGFNVGFGHSGDIFAYCTRDSGGAGSSSNSATTMQSEGGGTFSMHEKQCVQNYDGSITCSDSETMSRTGVQGTSNCGPGCVRWRTWSGGEPSDGPPLGANYQAGSGVTQGTQNVTCVISTCVKATKVSAGTVIVYAGSAENPARVPVCVSVGAGVSCP